MNTFHNEKTSNSNHQKIIFSFKSPRYNQYVQTHMSWHDTSTLTKQQSIEIPIRIIPPKNPLVKPLSSERPRKNQQAIKMPIPQFQMEHLSDSQIQDNEDLKISLGVSKENSFLISSQMTSIPCKINNTSIQTQTDDFTFLQDFYGEPKIYEIPVQVQVEQFPQICEKQIQVSESLLCQFLQRLQQNQSAVRKQLQLSMNSGMISVSVQNFSFSRFDKPFNDNFQGTNSLIKQTLENKGYFEQEEEMLLQDSPVNETKGNLQRTANFEMNFVNNQFLNGYTPQKSRISNIDSSPQIEQHILISQNEVNMMMQAKNSSKQKIDEQEYQDLQGRFFILQQQNEQKNEQSAELINRILILQQQIKKISQKLLQKQDSLLKYKQIQVKLQNAQRKIVNSQQQRVKIEEQFQKLLVQTQKKQQSIQELMFNRQQQIQQYQKQIKVYRQQLNSGQEKLLKQNEVLINMINEKQIQVNDIKSQYDRKYQLYQISIEEMKDKIKSYQIKMESMENVINKKDSKITQFKQEIRKIKEDNSILFRRIEDLKKQASQLSQESSSVEKQQKKESLKEIQQKNKIIQSAMVQHLQNNQVKQLNMNYHDRNSGINNSHKNMVSQYNIHQRGNYDSSKVIIEEQKQSDHKILHEKQSSHPGQSSDQIMKQQQGKFFISQSNQPSKFVNYSFQKYENHSLNPSNNVQYTIQLERIILVFQQIIQKQNQTIEELQQKVLEFLKDALTKESQAELLYNQLCQYQNSINGLMVEKIDVELQNQRLKRMITDSQSKLSILGNRLIKLAKNNTFSHSKPQFRDLNVSNQIQDR